MILVKVGILQKKSIHRARRVGTGEWVARQEGTEDVACARVG
jgi:hypothetical protein